MTSRSPFLQRRGFSLNFRMAVPSDLRQALGLREVTKALPTSTRNTGALLALQAAVVVKRVFAELRAGGMVMDKEKLAELMRAKREQLRLDVLKDEHQAELAAERRRMLQAVDRARLEGENVALRRVFAELGRSGVIESATDSTTRAVAPPGPSSPAPLASPALGDVVKDFLKRHRRDKSAMLKKHNTVLPLLVEVVGNKPIAALKQADIKRFLDLVQKLPPRWRDECQRRGISVIALAAETHTKTMSPKSFDDSYKACLRAFLKDAKAQWQDEGFPTTLTTDGNVYKGDRVEGENKQRAFRQDELERLLNGPEMAAFALGPALEHRYWMVYLGFYTGARVNELCQINPHVDVLQEAKTGIWYVVIADDTEGDERIEKSVKNKASQRKVPLHPNLMRMGFLAYVDRVKASRAKLLFPAFKPSRSRASSDGEKWFREFLRELGLRDETAGARLVGMHAFRHTLMALAYNSDPRQDVTPITGHRGGIDPVVAGYQGELSLKNKLRILQAIDFGSVAKAHSKTLSPTD
jgi:integrase